jgi:cytochrome c-type biogenesis protein CcmH
MTLLWLAIGLLTAGALLGLLWPLLRSAEPPAPVEGDAAVYRDQLGELKRDLDRNLIDPDAAAAARIEIERRLLATGASSPPLRRQSAVTRRQLVLALTLLVAAGALILYLELGWPGLPDQPLTRVPAAPTAIGADAPPPSAGLQPLADAAKLLAAKLDANPSDAAGWAKLGDLYLSLQRFEEAATALEQAIQQGADPKLTQSRYGEALTQLADGQVTPDAAIALRKGLAADPADPRSRFYLALAEAEAGRIDEAVAAWNQLLADAPADADWRALVEQTIAAAERAKANMAASSGAGSATPAPSESNAATAPSPAAGPSAEEMAAMANLTPEQREATIRSMVDGLAQRLQSDPNDLDGWLKLSRSYGVLGERDKALEALARAATLAPDRTDIQLDYAGALLQATPEAAPLPAAFDETLARVRAKEPGNLALLYFEGLGAVRAGKPAEARERWSKLLAALPADAPMRTNLEQQIKALPAD